MRIRLTLALTIASVASAQSDGDWKHPLEKCHMTRFATHYFNICVVSEPAGEKKRTFWLRVTDPTKLDKKSDGKHAPLVPETAIKVGEGEFVNIHLGGPTPVSDEDALIIIPILSGAPNQVTDGRALVFHLNVKKKKVTRVWDSSKCGAGCEDQALVVITNPNVPGKQVLIEQVAGGNKRTTEMKWDGKKLITSK